MSDRREGERRDPTSVWLEGVDKRHNYGRRFSDAPRVDPVASILRLVAADKNIAPAFTAAVDEHRTRDQIDFDEAGDAGLPYSPPDAPTTGFLS